MTVKAVGGGWMPSIFSPFFSFCFFGADLGSKANDCSGEDRIALITNLMWDGLRAIPIEG